MLLLGIVLLLVLVLVSAVVLTGASDQVRVSGVGIDVSITAGTLFVVGIVVGLLALVGFGLVLRGTARSARKRGEVRALRREAAAGHDVEAERGRIAAERDQLAADKSRLESTDRGRLPDGRPADAPRPGTSAPHAGDERLASPPERGEPPP